MKAILYSPTSKKAFVIFFMGIVLFFTIDVHAQIINTIAGDGTAGYNSDGIMATSAELNSPTGVAVDKYGNVFIADNENSRIRRVDASTGLISTIAGTTIPGYNGDGIAATSAEIDRPWNLSLDTAGNIYIASWADSRIRKVTVSTGLISTIAGNGTAAYNGDGIMATAAEVNMPAMAILDLAGNVFISDVNNQRIREINTSGIISTIAGNGTGGYNGDGIMATAAELHNPNTISLDSSDNVYIADYYNNRIRKITVSTGIISSIAGNGVGSYSGDGGQATASELYHPTGATFDVKGDIYVTDYSNNRIREIDATSGIINTIAGNGVAGYFGDGGMATAAELNNPWDIAISKDTFYIADWVNNRVRKVTLPSVTEIQQVSNKVELTIYPNPVFENLCIYTEGTNGKNRFTLFNVIGQQVWQEYSSDKRTNISVANLSSGIYFLKINTEEGTELTRKVCITKQ